MTENHPPQDPAALHALLQQAVVLRRQNDLAGTQRVLQAVLGIDARNYDALHMLGVLALDAGDGARAVELIGAAIGINGAHAAAHYNLGNALRLVGRTAEAIASYDRAIALRPEHARSHNNRANSLWDLKRYADAVAGYDRAVALEPGFADAWHNRGHALNELQRVDEAIDSYRRALAAGGDAARLEFELAALGAGSGPTPAAAPGRFVTNLFDRYAERFDEHLIGQLQYATPAAAVDAVRRVSAARELDVLDLGCGTGLCGPLLRPLARTLCGVDLSPRMLDKARERGGYDELVCADVAGFLQTRAAAYDLVIATDVFVYIGDLDAVFAGTRQALRTGGLFAFSVERGAEADFVLQPSKRYAHSEAYLRRLAAARGFDVASLEARFIRKDGATDIHGLIAVLRAA